MAIGLTVGSSCPQVAGEPGVLMGVGVFEDPWGNLRIEFPRRRGRAGDVRLAAQRLRRQLQAEGCEVSTEVAEATPEDPCFWFLARERAESPRVRELLAVYAGEVVDSWALA